MIFIVLLYQVVCLEDVFGFTPVKFHVSLENFTLMQQQQTTTEHRPNRGVTENVKVSKIHLKPWKQIVDSNRTITNKLPSRIPHSFVFDNSLSDIMLHDVIPHQAYENSRKAPKQLLKKQAQRIVQKHMKPMTTFVNKIKYKLYNHVDTSFVSDDGNYGGRSARNARPAGNGFSQLGLQFNNMKRKYRALNVRQPKTVGVFKFDSGRVQSHRRKTYNSHRLWTNM